MKKPTCIAFDFDSTLAYFSDELEGFYDIYRSYNVDDDVLKMALNSTITDTFSFPVYLARVAELTGKKFKEKDILAQCESWLRKNHTTFDGVHDFINRNISLLPIHIITFGNVDFQMQKIKLQKLDFLEMHVTSEMGKKGEVLETMLDKYGAPILFVDDNPKELDAVRKQFGVEDVITAFFDYYVKHGNVKEMEKNHLRLRSFQDIEKMLQNG